MAEAGDATGVNLTEQEKRDAESRKHPRAQWCIKGDRLVAGAWRGHSTGSLAPAAYRPGVQLLPSLRADTDVNGKQVPSVTVACRFRQCNSKRKRYNSRGFPSCSWWARRR